MKSVAALVLLASSLMAAQVQAHGYMTIPAPRTQGVFPDPTDEGACDSDAPGKVTEFKAGEEINVEWTRNNHLGGFIRYSIAPKDQANKETFDKNTFFYTCREANCNLKQCKDEMCADDPGSKDYEIKCSHKIKLPDYLDSGDYVLQWTWHSAGSSEGNVGWSTGNFKTCADIRLTTKGAGSKPKCPTFVGGDRVMGMRNKGTDKCFYFDDNAITKKYVKYDEAEGLKHYLEGIPKEIEQCGGGASAPAPAPAPAPVGSPSVAPVPAPQPAPQPAPAPAPAPAPVAGSGKFVYVGSHPDKAAMNTWCNQNCPNFCPGDMCKEA